MILKTGASLKLVQWQMFEAAIKVEDIYNGLGATCIITSGSDGKHGVNSLHYKGLALDFRTRDLSPLEQQELKQMCLQDLGKDYDVVLEEDHLHVEFDPK